MPCPSQTSEFNVPNYVRGKLCETFGFKLNDRGEMLDSKESFCVFSDAGHIVTKRRAALNSKHLNALMFKTMDEAVLTREKNLMVRNQVSKESVAKRRPVALQVPLGQGQSKLQGRCHVATANSSYAKAQDAYDELNHVNGVAEQLECGNLLHISNLKALDNCEDISLKGFVGVLRLLEEQFKTRYESMDKMEIWFSVFYIPFTVDFKDIKDTPLQMELIDL
ncbi:hypothetical protein ANN_02974 [Periplaneta americana]|uniref:Uncharacterized protein n=1 Tax=Periplaneta americana TaxID=6978 RepID=A0ABQ8TXR7_PERAM|nr:hypothetical protein ANN_02974 [Periplaneta americana]